MIGAPDNRLPITDSGLAKNASTSTSPIKEEKITRSNVQWHWRCQALGVKRQNRTHPRKVRLKQVLMESGSSIPTVQGRRHGWNRVLSPSHTPYLEHRIITDCLVPKRLVQTHSRRVSDVHVQKHLGLHKFSARLSRSSSAP